jgi:hypothetical protein
MKKELTEAHKLQKAAGILKEDYQEDPTIHKKSNIKVEDSVDEDYHQDPTIHKKSNMKEDTQKQTAIEYLKGLASKGELLPQDITDIADQLVKARRAYFTSKRSPESFKKAAEKGTKTKKISNATEKARDIVDKELNLKNPADRFALSISMHKNTKLQKKYNDMVTKAFDKIQGEFGLSGEKPDIMPMYNA